MITRDFDLWITQGHTKRLVFNANQYDQGETWRFRILGADGNPIVPTTAAIIGQKKDGHAILVQGTVSDGKVVITETEQMTACAGLTEFELLLNGETHGTANFTVQVEKRPGDDADLSDSDLSLIQDAVDAAEIITEVIGDSDPSEVIGEHVDAWLDNHPEATTTVEDGAITAPKINNSLWDKILVNEEASGNPASFDDGADDVPVSSLKVNLEPIQLGSGDPSPSNIRPIYPANNRNQFPSTADGTYTNSGVTVVANNGVYTVTGTGTATSYIEIPLVTSVDLSPSKNQLAFMNTVNDGNIEFAVYRDTTRVHYWAMSPQNRVTKNWTDTGNEVVNKIRFNFQNGMTYNITISPVLCLATYPTPTAFTPYQGIMVERCGKNMLETYKVGFDGHLSDSTRNGITLTKNADGSFKLSGTASAETRLNMLPTLKLLGGHTYTISIRGVPTNSELRLIVKGTNSSQSGLAYYSVYLTGDYQQTVNMLLDDTFQYFFIDVQNGKTVNCTIYVQVEMNDSMTAYEPYQSNTYPYALGQSVYGGTVDLATGVLTVTWASRTINGSENWARENGSATHYKYYINANDIGKPIGNNYKAEGTIICDKLTTAVNSFDYTTDSVAVTAWANHSVDNNYLYLIVNNANMGFDNVDGLKAWLASNPLQVVYLLATPTTVQLTSTEVKTLLGYNNISSSGTVDVIYHADTKLYVDKMTNVDNNIIAPTEADFVATRNYTVGDLVIVNDTLYKVTANIASGSTITPNSNVTQTTLGALIKALS